ncbi:MAG: hypothetical protein D3923_17250, partial [Candidatus Electrothrix sp. AR3]|nr:hypothetical protein [Candidatus Electrothrix sp. AR3]
MFLFCFAFFAIAIFFMFFSSFEKHYTNRIIEFFLLLVPLTLVGRGCNMLYSSTLPVVFDKRKGFFWKGWKAFYEITNWKARKHCIKLEEIHSIQLITERITFEGDEENKNAFFNYELNLVLKETSRINVIYHNKKSEIRNDGITL